MKRHTNNRTPARNAGGKFTQKFLLKEKRGAIAIPEEIGQANEKTEEEIHEQILEKYVDDVDRTRRKKSQILMEKVEFINRRGQPLRLMPRLELDPALLEQPLYH